MENQTQRYSVIIYTENHIGLLSQFSNIFTRRNLSIWSVLALPTDLDGIHYLTIVTDGDEKKVQEAVRHIEKIVDVVKAYSCQGNLIEDPEEHIYEQSKNKVKDFIEKRYLERKNIKNQ